MEVHTEQTDHHDASEWVELIHGLMDLGLGPSEMLSMKYKKVSTVMMKENRPH